MSGGNRAVELRFGGGRRDFGEQSQIGLVDGGFISFFSGVFAIVFEATKVAEGSEERTLEGGDLGKDSAEEFGGGGVAEDGDVEVFGVGAFGEEGAVEFAFGPLEAAFLPIAADEGLDVELLESGGGTELGMVVLRDFIV